MGRDKLKSNQYFAVEVDLYIQPLYFKVARERDIFMELRKWMELHKVEPVIERIYALNKRPREIDNVT